MRGAEPSGDYAATDGRLAIALDLAMNDRPGIWRVHVREGVLGRENTLCFTVLP